MRPAELCAAERTPGAGVAHRKGFFQSVGGSAPIDMSDCGGGGGVAVAVGEGESMIGAYSSAIAVGSADQAFAAPSAASSDSAEQSAGLGSRPYFAAKVAVEWFVALGLLLVSAPLIAVLAALVKLTSKGPAFYLQTRLGRDGRAYRICKLRTMAHNCEAATGPVWASKDDVRITPIGKVLRETHMDELPQLWNVIRGQMALIGPRPERPEIIGRIERQLPGYRGRLAVRPGVTGLAQMRLPADSDLESVRLKLEHDLYYIRNVGPLMDLRIAACTVFYFMAAACSAVCDSAVGPYAREVRAKVKAEAAARAATTGAEAA